MKPTDRIAFVLGTWFGCGLSKIAPGTVGSLGALPLHFALSRLSQVEHWSAVVLISLVGIWASHRVSVVLGQKDPQRVVIDEVAGVLIAMGAVRSFGPMAIAVAFALFRLFDIT
jgi:phosphatidylglycerophosphatase A